MVISIHVPPPAGGSWRLISHQKAFPPGSQVLSGTKTSLLKPPLFQKGTRESVAGSLSGCTVVPHAFLSVLIKILCDLFTANTIHCSQAGRNNQLVFQAMIFSQEPDVEHSQFYTSTSASRIPGKCVLLFPLHCVSSPQMSFHLTLPVLVTWIFYALMNFAWPSGNSL